MPDISVLAEGIYKLLVGLNPCKAAGPAKLKPIVLQALHKEFAPIMQLIFTRSLDTRKLHAIWKEENVSPIFKKGENLTLPTTDENIKMSYPLRAVRIFKRKRGCQTDLFRIINPLQGP